MNKIQSILTALVLMASLQVGAADRAPVKPINLNTATATELMQLPRVGQKTAELIIAFRKQHGAFRNTEELMNVKGIGEKSYQRMKAHVLVSGSHSAPATQVNKSSKK